MMLRWWCVRNPFCPYLPQPAGRVWRASRAIVRHPERQDGAADWARELGVDPKTVHRLFLRHTGMTFGRWRRAERACWRPWVTGARRGAVLESGADFAG